MATYKKPDQSLEYQIPNEGELFLGAGNGTNNPVVYKRVGNIIHHTQVNQDDFLNNYYGKLNTYNTGDLTSTGLFNPGSRVGAGDYFKPFAQNASMFTNAPVATANVTAPVDPNLSKLVASGGAGIGGFSAGGAAGSAAGLALSQTPQAKQNQQLAMEQNVQPNDQLGALKNQLLALQKDLGFANTLPNKLTGITSSNPGFGVGNSSDPRAMALASIQKQIYAISAQLPKSLAVQPNGIVNSSSLTSAAVAPSPTPSYATVAPSPIPDVSKLDTSVTATDQTLTPTQQQAQDLTTQLQGLQNKMLGQSAYRAQQEAALGLPDLQKVQNDLAAQLKALQNDALAIPLQAQGDVTTTGLIQRNTDAQLRTNAIKALTINSLLEASRGNLASAQDSVERAVHAKYDPILEEQQVKLANLDLILKSPQYSLEEKNQAARQKQIEDAQTAIVNYQATNQAAAIKAANEYSGSGASSLDLNTMSKMSSEAEVRAYAASKGIMTLEQRKLKLEGDKIASELGGGGTSVVGGVGGAGGQTYITPADQKVLDNFSKDPKIQDLEIRSDAYNQIKSAFPQGPDSITSADITGGNAAILKNQLARYYNPKSARTGAVDPFEFTSASGLIGKIKNWIVGGANVSVGDVQDALRNLDTSYAQFQSETNAVANDFAKRVSNPAVINTAYATAKGEIQKPKVVDTTTLPIGTVFEKNGKRYQKVEGGVMEL